MFIIVIFLFLAYIYGLTLLWNLGFMFNMLVVLLPAFAVLFYAAGVLIQNSKMNWSIGIRTPWTMSSEKVWNKTHSLGGKLFKVCSFIILLGIFVPDYAFWLMFVPIIVAALFPVAYSYFEYQKEKM
jgi:uncharacterized membrane protein